MKAIRERRSEKGFTLIEIMIVVLIIGILLAIAVPNFIKARETSRTKSCVSNLKQIEAAKEQWAMDNKKASTDEPAIAVLWGADGYIKKNPTCPSDSAQADYVPNAVNADPACPVFAANPTHSLAYVAP